ncbi:MAG TPA: HlyD family efflux transporter periplasmic adaptor subunit, partial [Gemmatimonadaceae bacterium]|nr:HlyD family efflux transporter periplasmic adaptor subunit [Gemmatimonadaceae bacterium]
MATKPARRRLVLAASLVALAAVVALVLRPERLPVDVEAVRRGPLEVTIDAEGRTRVQDRFVVVAPVTGRLERLAIAEGAPVRRGALLARLAPAPSDEPTARQARARAESARAALAGAVTRVHLAATAADQAARDARRARAVADAGGLAQRALEEATTAERLRVDELAAARAAEAAARAELAQAAAALLYARGDGHAATLVRAPGDGIVLRIPDRSERVVAAGTPIVEVGDTRHLEVVVDLLSGDAARVLPGMEVRLEGWGDETAARGRVRLVEPAATTKLSALGVEEQRVNVIVDVLDPSAGLGDGFRVDARIVLSRDAAVLLVPTSALVRGAEGWSAYRV